MPLQVAAYCKNKILLLHLTMQNQQKIQEIQKEIQLRFLEWQKSAKYPKANYPKDSRIEKISAKSFLYYTPQHLKLSLEDFKELADTKFGDYNLHQVSNILYMIQNLTANDFELSLKDYFEVQEEVKSMVTKWQLIVNPKNIELTDEGNAKIQILQDEEAAKMNEKINQDLKAEKGRTIEMPVAQS